jgi:hypothetical protein
MKGVLSCLLVRWALRASTRDLCLAFAALVGPVQSTVILTIHHFNLLVSIAQHDRQAVALGHLSLSVCPWSGFSLYNIVGMMMTFSVYVPTGVFLHNFEIGLQKIDFFAKTNSLPPNHRIFLPLCISDQHKYTQFFVKLLTVVFINSLRNFREHFNIPNLFTHFWPFLQ